jgi:hypothetical protein
LSKFIIFVGAQQIALDIKNQAKIKEKEESCWVLVGAFIDDDTTRQFMVIAIVRCLLK